MTRAYNTATTQQNSGGAVAGVTAGKNPVLNSAFNVWQRGTANVTTGSAYTADRWQKGSATHYGVSRQVTGDTTNLPNIQYCARVQRTSGSATTNASEFAQSFETINSIPFVGKTVTVSWYARKGADFSSATSTMTMSLLYGTGTDQSIIGTYTGAAYAINQAPATLTTTWQRFTATGTIPTTATEIALYTANSFVGTAGTNDYYEITGVQLEVGSVATPYTPYSSTYQGELAACQRYYYLHSTGSGKGVALGTYYSASDMRAYVGLPVTMRTTPTLSAGSGTNFYRIISAGVSTDYFNSFTLEAGYAQTAIIQNSTEVSGTAGYAGIVSCESGTNSFVAFSAEL
jgi:hypothetical protein